MQYINMEEIMDKANCHIGICSYLLYIVAAIFSFIIVICVICVIPAILDHLKISGDWLSFWGSYMGGLLAIIGTFMVIMVSLKQIRDSNKNAQNSIEQLIKSERRNFGLKVIDDIAELERYIIEFYNYNIRAVQISQCDVKEENAINRQKIEEERKHCEYGVEKSKSMIIKYRSLLDMELVCDDERKLFNLLVQLYRDVQVDILAYDDQKMNISLNKYTGDVRSLQERFNQLENRLNGVRRYTKKLYGKDILIK